jgi:hypothetical protein
MIKSKFIDVIRTFSPGELKQFRDFLRSPFHNTNKKVIKLFEIVRKYSPDYNSHQLEKENLFKILYPGKKYNDLVMRILISDSMRLSEEFLAYSRFSSEPMEEKVLLLKEYSGRNLNSLFDTTLKRSELKLPKVIFQVRYSSLTGCLLRGKRLTTTSSWTGRNSTVKTCSPTVNTWYHFLCLAC